MKLSYVALFLTAGLLAYTAYLSLQSREATNQKIEDLAEEVRDNKEKAAAEQAAETKLWEAELAAARRENELLRIKNEQVVAESLKKQLEAEALKEENEVVAGGATKAIAAATAGGGEPGELTPQQVKIKEAVSIGEVKAYEAEYGFVVLNRGADNNIEPGMRFAIRRNYFIVGRIQVDSVEEDEAIANVGKGSVPIGFTIRKGDTVIMAEDAGIF